MKKYFKCRFNIRNLIEIVIIIKYLEYVMYFITHVTRKYFIQECKVSDVMDLWLMIIILELYSYRI